MGREEADHICEVKVKEESAHTGQKAYVEPGHQKVKNNDVVSWNIKDTGAVFFFPRKELFGKTEYRVEKGDSLSLRVNGNAEKGHYPYAVYTENNDFAEGGSHPMIIVE